MCVSDNQSPGELGAFAPCPAPSSGVWRRSRLGSNKDLLREHRSAPGFAGVADYGVYAIGNTSLAQTQCDIANLACIYVLSPTAAALADAGPGQITDTQMKCGSLPSAPPNYHGVELSAGVVDATVSGTASSNRCQVPPAQLVVVDGTPDQTVSLCNNSNALLVFCAGYQSGFANSPATRYYTQPSLGYSTVTLTGAATNTPLYAIPFINPSGGTITQMGVQVTAGIGSGQCDLGIYSSVNGAPGVLLLDSGAVAANAMGMKTNVGLNFIVQPNTLYFLAVGCNANVGVKGTSNPAGFAGLLLGQPDFLTSGAVSVTGTWLTYGIKGLPATFPPYTFGTATVVPNVYVGPT